MVTSVRHVRAIALAGLLALGCSAIVPQVPPPWTTWVTRHGATFERITEPPAGMISAAQALAKAQGEVMRWWAPAKGPNRRPGPATQPVLGIVSCTQDPRCPNLWSALVTGEPVRSAAVWVIEFPQDHVFVVVEAQSGFDFTVFG